MQFEEVTECPKFEDLIKERRFEPKTAPRYEFLNKNERSVQQLEHALTTSRDMIGNPCCPTCNQFQKMLVSVLEYAPLTIGPLLNHGRYITYIIHLTDNYITLKHASIEESKCDLSGAKKAFPGKIAFRHLLKEDENFKTINIEINKFVGAIAHKIDLEYLIPHPTKDPHSMLLLSDHNLDMNCMDFNATEELYKKSSIVPNT